MNVHISEHWQRFIQEEVQRGRSAFAAQMVAQGAGQSQKWQHVH